MKGATIDIFSSPRTYGLAVALIGGATLVGHVFQISSLVQLFPDTVGMMISTALCLVFAGVAVALPAGARGRVLLGMVLVAAGLASGLENLFDFSLGIDLAPLHRWLALPAPRPGRMAPNTAIAFTLSGLILALVPRGAKRAARRGIELMIGCVFAIGLAGLAGYAVQAERLYNWGRFNSMALATAMAFVVLAGGLWAALLREHPRAGLDIKVDHKIVLLAAFVLVTVASITGLASFSVMEDRLGSALAEGLQQAVRTRQELFRADLGHARDSALGAASRPSVRSALRQAHAGDELAIALDSLLAAGFSGVAAYNREGQLLRAQGELSAAPALAVPVDANPFADLRWDKRLLIRQKVEVRDGSHILGSLLLERPAPNLQRALLQPAGFGATGEFGVCARIDDRAACFPQKRIPRVYSSALTTSDGRKLPVVRGIDGEVGLYKGLDFRGHFVLAAYAPLAGGLGMVLKQDTEELYGPIREQLHKALPLVLAGIAIGLALLGVQVRPLAKRLVDENRHLAGDLRQKTRALVKSEAELRLAANVLEHTGEGVVITQRGRILSVNRAFTAITGYSPEEVVGQRINMLYSPLHHRLHRLRRRSAVRRGGLWLGETWNRRKNGEVYPAWTSVSAVQDEDGHVTHHVRVFSDVSLNKKYEERLHHLAHHDTLTGLPNRVLGYERLGDMLARARRHGAVVAVLFVDLDRFKPINDSLGHAMGDQLLQRVAERLQESVRSTDLVARLGGDEFMVLVDELTTMDESAIIAQNVIDTLSRHFIVSGHELFISASVGIACYPNDGETRDVLIQHADSAMYQAKLDGRNSYRFFSSDMNAHAREKLLLTNSLRHGIERGELVLAYQPRVSLTDGRVTGIEALVRWQHPEQGMILPARFISLAEETGMIEQLGAWVLKTAVAQMQTWRAAGLVSCRIAVNLSAAQFVLADLEGRISGILAEAGLPPEYLELELTESLMMQNPEQADKVLSSLTACGIAVAVDDFGTGYSSLSYLKRFPVGCLKIDQSFVAGVPDTPEDAALTRAIIAMAKGLELSVVAEGVENEQQLAFLRENRCDSGQGYFFARPLDAQGMAAFLAERLAPVEQGSAA